VVTRLIVANTTTITPTVKPTQTMRTVSYTNAETGSKIAFDLRFLS
jgi:hypothetical protein